MGDLDRCLSKTYLLDGMPEVGYLEKLWAACLEVTSEMGFDYYCYQIHCPTPFTNPRVITYGNFPLNTSSILEQKDTNKTAGRFAVCAECVATLNQVSLLRPSRDICLNDLIFYTIQSTPRPGGLMEHFFLARAHNKIDRGELRTLQSAIKNIASEVYQALFTLSPEFMRVIRLTPREKEILLWGADGKTSEEIGIILGISQDSINFHYKSIKKKTGTTNRAQAIAHLVAKGYL